MLKCVDCLVGKYVSNCLKYLKNKLPFFHVTQAEISYILVAMWDLKPD